MFLSKNYSKKRNPKPVHRTGQRLVTKLKFFIYDERLINSNLINKKQIRNFREKNVSNLIRIYLENIKPNLVQI